MKFSPQKSKNLAHEFDANNAPSGPFYQEFKIVVKYLMARILE
jgi:hypothetical protein